MTFFFFQRHVCAHFSGRDQITSITDEPEDKASFTYSCMQMRL